MRREEPSQPATCPLVFSTAPRSILDVMNTQRIVVKVASKLSSA
jgi:hypothetical protein